MTRYYLTGIFLKDGVEESNTLSYSRKSDLVEVIKGNLTRDNFDTLVIRRIED